MTEFESVYRSYFRDVELYLLALCKDGHLAQELTAQTFFKALQAYPQFRGNCDIRTWLCAIGRNCYLSYCRNNKRTISLEEVTVPDSSVSIEEMVVNKDQTLRIHRILHSLPEPYKEVFTLRVFGQLSFADIGGLFGKNQNWACVTYHRARRKIKDGMEASE